MAALALAIPLETGAFELTAEERAALVRGEQVVRPLASAGRGDRYGGTALVLIDAPVERVEAAIEDLAAYPEMFPMVVSARLVGRRAGLEVVQMRQGTRVFSLVYHMAVHRVPERHIIRFCLVPALPHDIEDVAGFWRLFPQDGGRTLVVYAISARIDLSLLGLIDRVGAEIQQRLVGMPGHLKRWLERRAPAPSPGAAGTDS